MATKSFGGKKKGHTFTLAGEEFHTYPGMSVTFVNTEDEEEAQLKPVQSIIKFIRTLVVKEEREKLDRLLNDPDVYIDVDDLLELARWLVEVTSGRPTKSPSSSGNGAGRTSSGSKAKPSKPVSSGKN